VFPVSVQVAARWPETVTVVGSGSASFDKAPVAVAPASRYVDLAIDPSTMPGLDITGTLRQAGVPMAGPVTIRIDAFNANGRLLAQYEEEALPAADSGSFGLVVALHRAAASATVSAKIGVATTDWYVVGVPEVTIGAPTPVALVVDYDPTVLTVRGALTDAAGAAIVGVVPVVVVASGPGGVLGTTTDTVTPGVLGAYSFTRLLPLGTTSVTATAQVGRFESDWVSVTDVVSPLTKTQTLTLDAGYRPPVLTVHGTLVDASGAPLGGTRISVDAYDSNAPDAAPTGSIALDVNPAASSGAFSGTVTLPTGTTRVVARAGVGPLGGDTIDAELAGVVAGPNDLLLSGVYNPPTLDISGSMFGADGAALAGDQLVLIEEYATTTLLRSAYYTVRVNALGAVEPHTFVTLPLATVRVALTPLVGAFAQDRVRVSQLVSAGPNAVTLSVAIAAPILHLTGTYLRDGELVTGPLALIVESYGPVLPNGSSELISRQFPVVQASSGAYVYNAQLPTGTVRTVITAKISPFTGDNPTTGQALTNGLNTVTFDVTDVTRSLRLTGVVTRAGLPVAGHMTVQIRSWNADVELALRIYSVTAASDGTYVLEEQLPDQTDRVQVYFTVPIPGQAAQTYNHSTTIAGNGLTTDTFDISQSTVVRVTGPGLRTPLGLQKTGFLLTVIAWDGIGADPLQSISRWVTPNSTTGAFDESFVVPDGTVTVSVGTSFQPWSYPYVGANVTPGTTTTVELLSEKPAGLLIHGSAVLPAGELIGNLASEVPVTVAFSNPANPALSSEVGTATYLQFDRSFDLHVLMPSLPDGATFTTATEADVTFGFATPVTVHVAGLGLGVNDREINPLIDAGVAHISGVVTDNGASGPDGSPVALRVVAYHFDPADHFNRAPGTPPYTVLGSIYLDGVVTDSSGHYSVDVVLPPGTTLVEADFKDQFSTGSDGWQRAGVMVDPVHVTQVPLDVQVGSPARVTIAGPLTQPQECLDAGAFTFVGHRTMTAYTSQVPAAWDGTTPIDGGTVVFDSLIIPDPGNGDYQMAVPLPAGVTGLLIMLEGAPAYVNDQIASSSSFMFDWTYGTALVSIGGTEQLHCPASVPPPPPPPPPVP
jgi:hypothetical protein